jgi:hypothetical protein
MAATTNDIKYPLSVFDDCIKSHNYAEPSKEVCGIIHEIAESLKGSAKSWNDNRARFVSNGHKHSHSHPHSSGSSGSSGFSGSSGSGSGSFTSGFSSQPRMPVSMPNTKPKPWNSNTNAEPGSGSGTASESESKEKINAYRPTTTILGNVTTGFESQLLLIRTYLNKTTDKNKADMHTKITNILSQIIHPDMVEENMEKLAHMIYAVSAVNKFYSSLFAGLYVELVDAYPRLLPVLTEKYQKLNDLSIFDGIVLNADDTSYEQCCKNNKANDTLKAEITFLANILIIKGERETAMNALDAVVQKIIVGKMDVSEKAKNDEWIEYVYILYKSLYPFIEIEMGSASPYSKVLELSKCRAKMCPGLNSKLIFKCMELIEMK